MRILFEYYINIWLLQDGYTFIYNEEIFLGKDNERKPKKPK